MHFFNIRSWNSFLERHSEHSFGCELVVNFRNSYIFVVLKNFLASFRVACLFDEVKLCWQTGLEFLREPSIFKVRENCHRTVRCKLNQSEVTWNLLLDPHMLHLYCDFLPRRFQPRSMNLPQRSTGDWFCIELRINFFERFSKLTLDNNFDILIFCFRSLLKHRLECDDILFWQ